MTQTNLASTEKPAQRRLSPRQRNEIERQKRELESRIAARAHLLDFVLFTMPRYEIAEHHRLIAEHLERVERGEILRLMIVAPPRHGKTELVSKRAPAWFLGKRPDRQIIAASYGQDLSRDFGREVRNIVASSEFHRVFSSVSLAEDSTAADRWHTSQGGAYIAAGVGTAITGRGADLLLIDDPVKDRQEADSELMRERVWDWYRGVAYTRLQPGGAVVVVQTRWHEDDLAGRLLAMQAAGGPDKWTVLHLPAISNAGDALWPGRYPLEALRRIRDTIGPRDWSALYQGAPAPETGDYFKAEWLQTMPAPPREQLMVYGASDYAVTDKGGDYTVHIVVGLDAAENMYVLDIWRGQSDPSVWVEAWCDLVRKWNPMEWAEEAGQIRAAVGPFLAKRQQERQAWCPRTPFPSKHDKSVRAQSIRGRMALRGLRLPVAASWLSDLRSELLSFPAGKNDDQADALGLVGQLLDRVRAAPLNKAKALVYSSKGIV